MSQHPPSKTVLNRPVVVIGLTLIMMLALRIALWGSSKSIWGDEWFRIDAVEKTIFESLRFEIFSQNHPPVYQLLISLWGQIFGTSERALRGFSQILNFMIILGTYGIARELFNRNIARLSALFVGISPYFFHLSNEIRSYSTLAFFSTFGLYFMLRARRQSDQPVWKFAYGFCALLTIYTEHYGWFWLFSASLFLIYEIMTRWPQEKKWIHIQTIVGLLAVPSIALIVYQSLNDEKIFSATKLEPYKNYLDMSKKALGIFWHFSSGPIYSMLSMERISYLIKHSVGFWLSFLLTAFMFALYLKSLIDFFYSRKGLFILLSTMILFPVFFLLYFYPIRLNSRYLCWAVPLFFIAISYSIHKIQNKWFRGMIVVSYLLYSLIADIYIIQLPTDPMHKEDYKGMLQYAVQNASEKDAIIGVGMQTTYYLKQMGIQPRSVYFTDINEALRVLNKRPFDRLWTLHYINMKPEITEQIMQDIDQMLRPFDYQRHGLLQRFGGPDALTALQLYIPAKSTHQSASQPIVEQA